MIFERNGADAMTAPWMARVASKSNVADPPSRANLSDIDFLKPYNIVFPVCPLTKIPLVSIIGSEGMGEDMMF